MTQTSEEIQEQIAVLQDKLTTAKKREASLTDSQKLAILLHEEFCTFNHIDQCFWTYDNDLNPKSWENKDGERQRYLGQAERLMKAFPDFTNKKFKKMIRMLNSY